MGLSVALHTFPTSKEAAGYRAGPDAFAVALLDTHVTLGIFFSATGRSWNAHPDVAAVHPAWSWPP